MSYEQRKAYNNNTFFFGLKMIYGNGIKSMFLSWLFGIYKKMFISCVYIFMLYIPT